jgi:DedD protein
MIRLQDLFRRKTQADDLPSGALARDRRNGTKLPQRSFQRNQTNEDLALTEDPERQRARHRLIGAAVLVLITVIGLPRILDNNPKSVNNDIAVNILTSLPAPLAAISPAQEKIPASKATSKDPVDEKGVTANNSASIPDLKTDTKAKLEAQADVKNESKTEPKPTSQSKPDGLGLAAGEEVVAASKLKTEDATKKSSLTSKFIVQIGAFASEERAKGWTAKLKDQKIPYSVSNKTNADGTKLFVLRAGPFSDKESGEAAEKKIKAMGLSPRLVEVGEP